ncbi:MAG: sulfurtransferase [Rhodospirillales bacterium]|nr:sulfurtransferase [Alphaproteobacteria bacterium]MCB9987426.1 sulfurtransferase [Rhodospirillales bacterium]USO07592.1 MAG: sulfurtransferase [Rhodospirillales bacterium]
MQQQQPDEDTALIDAATLAAQIGRYRILDASYGVPDAAGAFAAGHIPGARFFDIDAVAAPDAPYPHTLPAPADFARDVGALGIGNDDAVVVYDQNGVSFAAARVWWMFRVMGHARVQVLDGGLPAWRAGGFPLENGPAHAPLPRNFTAHYHPALYRDFDAIEAASENGSTLIVDARSAARFAATVHTPDGDAVPAHIPGSRSLPYTDFLDMAGQHMPCDAATSAAVALRADGRPIVASCGSGVTACVLALGLYQAGLRDVAVFDGSWTEWSDRLGLK